MKPTSTSLWQDCLLLLQDQMSATDFDTWLRPLQADIPSENTIVLYAPNIFVRSWVETHYLEQITKLVQQLAQNTNLIVRVQDGIKPAAKPVETQEKAISQSVVTEETEVKNAYRSNLNTKQVFENFVEGKSNQLARAIAQKVANNPGEQSANPLFLYGGTGLGKTHLLHAVGNGICTHNPNARVIYIHAERFMQEYVKSLKSDTMEKFKKFYRTLDALLIDDIQFFAGKDGTQEEFFHIFNSLFESSRQIILTSDRYPKEIEKIEDRLKSRFGWGLTIAIEPPDLETRVAILLKKAEEKNQERHEKEAKEAIILPEEVAFFVGQKLRSNVRELEGSLNKLFAMAEFKGEKVISIDFVRETLKDMLALQDKLVTVDNIQKVVAEYYRIKVSDLKSKNRSRSIARPRQLAMALAKELTNRSLPEIGKGFGDRDHTTVLHACRTIATLREEDNNIQEDWSNLIRTLSA